jgi:hypothetical protein
MSLNLETLPPESGLEEMMTVPEDTWRRLLLRWNQRVNLTGRCFY